MLLYGNEVISACGPIRLPRLDLKGRAERSKFAPLPNVNISVFAKIVLLRDLHKYTILTFKKCLSKIHAFP